MLKTNLQVCTVLEKTKKNSIKILQRNNKSFVMVTYKWLNTIKQMLNYQIHKLKTTFKNQTGTLRMNIKMFNGNNLPHELLLTTRQKTKLRNAFENDMLTGIKLSKAQISRIIQSGRLLGSLLSKLAGPLMKVTVPLAKNILAPLGIPAAA